MSVLCLEVWIWWNRSKGSNRRLDPCSRIICARSIQSVSSPSIKWSITLKGLQVSGPSLECVQSPDRPSKSVRGTAGLRSRMAMLPAGSKFMTVSGVGRHNGYRCIGKIPPSPGNINHDTPIKFVYCLSGCISLVSGTTSSIRILSELA